MLALRAPAVMTALEGVVVTAGSRRVLDVERWRESVGSRLCLNLSGDACAAKPATSRDQEQEGGAAAPECSEAAMAVWLRWASARLVGH